MAEARRIGFADLREIVTDGEEIVKGLELLDRAAIRHFARFEDKLFAEAKGQSAVPYRVTITIPDGTTRTLARCTCLAARSRPFCKHAAGLLLAWARTPESFAVADSAPEGIGEKKKRAVKRGKTSAADLGRAGVEQVDVLVRELSASGVVSIPEGRVAQVRGLGENLREHRLRRLSMRTLALAGMLEDAVSDPASLDPLEYTTAVTDMLLLARRLERHFAGEELEPRHVEELIGKTWRKNDRTPVADLDLVEYAFFHRTTNDDFIIRESRFFDAATGAHYAEKQILPAFLARRTEPKKSYYGRVLAGARGSVYPGFSPCRIDLESTGTPRALDAEALEAMLRRALPDVGAALASFQERRRDVFAPDGIPVALAAWTLFPQGGRLLAVDDSDRALFLPADRELEERLAAALLEVRLRALVGDIVLEGVLPTLHPLAVIVERGGQLELRNLQAVSSFGGTHKVKIKRGPRRGPSPWLQSARDAGASAAAIALAEVREELASLFSAGLGTLDARRAEPLVDRLRSLGLEKPAAALAEAAALEALEGRLPGFVKIFQVLEMAVVRLLSAAHVDRATLEPVPLHDSVAVPRVEVALTPREVEAERRRDALDRWRAMVHTARFLEALPDEALADHVHPAFDDGGLRPILADVLGRRGEAVVPIAEAVLDGPTSHTAKLAAVAILARAGGDRAESRLAEVARQRRSPALTCQAEVALTQAALRHANPSAPRARQLEKNERARVERMQTQQAVLLVAGRREDRVHAAHELEACGDPTSFPALRLSFSGDISREVREAAAKALAEMGDASMVETFVEMVRARDTDDATARVGLAALIRLGDIRGLGELLRTLAEGWKPPAVKAALQAIGPAIAEPLLELFEQRPALLDKKPARDTLAEVPAPTLIQALLTRLGEDTRDRARFVQRATLLLRAASVEPEAARALADRVRVLAPLEPEGEAATESERELARLLGLTRRKKATGTTRRRAPKT